MPLITRHNGRGLYRYKQQIFTAMRGMVHVFDERDGSRTQASVADFRARAKALGLEAALCNFPSERDGLQDAARCMEACASEAAAQGDPTKAEDVAYKVRHKPHNSILVGAGQSQLQGDRKLYVPGE